MRQLHAKYSVPRWFAVTKRVTRDHAKPLGLKFICFKTWVLGQRLFCWSAMENTFPPMQLSSAFASQKSPRPFDLDFSAPNSGHRISGSAILLFPLVLEKETRAPSPLPFCTGLPPEKQSDKSQVFIQHHVPRVGSRVASLLLDNLRPKAEKSNIKLATVDIAEFKLPVFDENVIPATVPAKASFAHDHTKAWSSEMEKYDGYIVLSPEYNFGPPGGLKNAIDYLYNEIKGKPVLIVTYGAKGGIFASEMLDKIFSGMGLQVCATRPSLPFQGPDIASAMSEGILADATRQAWDQGRMTEIFKGFTELEQALKANSA
uniref:NAD(P)H-dependent FMN reductase LOT6 n=1 Tax=Coccidioides posadasii RMSCC 3488 TaxID=454284 RepID=A0A0J6IDJ9_COCPO|nr:NAD(P)H-dependent FMN reductase LOT6 [Coccidioides posadasii RMSCC 3488]